MEAELQLELVEGELAAGLPAHMRAFARAHAEGRSSPPAPLVARLASTLDVARDALAHDVLVDRALALLRLVAPIVIEDDAAVTTARGEAPSWQGLARLAAARDAIASKRFGSGAIAWLHRLHGVVEPTPQIDAPGPPIEGWHTPDASLDQAAIADAWQVIAARLGVTGRVRVDPAARSESGPLHLRRAGRQPRAFVIEPGVEVIVVVPAAIDTPAARFAVLHELGHAAAAFALPAGTPRVLDEAAAAYVALDAPGWLTPKWTSPLAASARRRRLAIAAMLDGVERALPDLQDTPGAAPPWALWHDPGAQAAYVAAEALADELARDLGPRPPRGQFARTLELVRARIDRRTRV
jgi:hypothetical protein